jgi:glycosyltransferase involved in cell wall biosynthesis
MRPLRIAVIANMVDPNRVALFERIARREEIELLVIYETGMEANRSWEVTNDLPYRHIRLRSASVDLRRLGTDAYLHLPIRPLEPISSFGPDVVVGAGGGIWSSPANLAAFAARRRKGWAFIPWWGSFPRDQPSIVRRLSEPWVRHFVSHSDLCLAYGTRAARELERLGVAPTAIRCVPNAVPRGELGTPRLRPNRPVRFLFVGQLIARKGVAELLNAFSQLPEGELYIAGEGPLQAPVNRAVQAGRVTYAGQVARSALQQLYADSDVLVLPSRYEVWGLVINEALEHGLPVVATQAVGAVDDLVLSDVNGYVTRTGDVDELREAMARIAGWDDGRWRSAATAGAEIVERWSIDAAATAFVDACRAGAEASVAGRSVA